MAGGDNIVFQILNAPLTGMPCFAYQSHQIISAFPADMASANNG